MPISANATFRFRGYLLHLERPTATYFVTFRLKDSLPQELLKELSEQRLVLERAKRTGVITATNEKTLHRMRALLRKAERCLDGGRGACYMRDHRVAKFVANSLTHFDCTRYRLIAWCVMPNHVHAVLSPFTGRLDPILHSWKSFSALEANRILGRSGPFWQREYFDHLIRNERSLARITRYVLDNPQKAGLKNWQWTFCNDGFQPADCAFGSVLGSPGGRQDGGVTK